MLVTKQRATLRSKERDIKDLKIEIAHCKAELLTTLDQKQVDCENFFSKLATSQGKEQIMKTFDEWKSDLEKEQEPKPEKTEILLKNYFNLYMRSSESMGKIFQTLEQFYSHCRKFSVLTPELRELFGTCREIMTREDMFYDPTLTYSPCGTRRRDELILNRTPLMGNVQRQIGFISPPKEEESEEGLCEISPRKRTLSLGSVSMEEKQGGTPSSIADASESTCNAVDIFKKLNVSLDFGSNASSINSSIDMSPLNLSVITDTNSKLDTFDRHLHELEKARRDLDVESNRSAAQLSAKGKNKWKKSHPSRDQGRRIRGLNEQKCPSSVGKTEFVTTTCDSRNGSFNSRTRASTPILAQSQFLKPNKPAPLTDLKVDEEESKDRILVGSVPSEKLEDSGNITPDLFSKRTAPQETSSLECCTPFSSNCHPKPQETVASKTIPNYKTRRRIVTTGSFSAPKLKLQPKAPSHKETRIMLPKLNLNMIHSESRIKTNSARISEPKEKKKKGGFSSSRLRRPSIFYKSQIEKPPSTTCELEHPPTKKYKNMRGSPVYKRKRRKSLWGNITLPLPDKTNDTKARPKRKRRATTIMYRKNTAKLVQKPFASRKKKKKRPLWT